MPFPPTINCHEHIHGQIPYGHGIWHSASGKSLSTVNQNSVAKKPLYQLQKGFEIAVSLFNTQGYESITSCLVYYVTEWGKSIRLKVRFCGVIHGTNAALGSIWCGFKAITIKIFKNCHCRRTMSSICNPIELFVSIQSTTHF